MRCIIVSLILIIQPVILNAVKNLKHKVNGYQIPHCVQHNRANIM